MELDGSEQRNLEEIEGNPKQESREQGRLFATKVREKKLRGTLEYFWNFWGK